MELDKQSVTVPQLRTLAHNFGSTHFGLEAGLMKEGLRSQCARSGE